MVEQNSATCVKTYQKDALKMNADTVKHVEFILVDPSCSGSGKSIEILKIRDKD